MMGEAKRRKQQVNSNYGNPENEPAWEGSPFTKGQMQQAYELTTKGAWIGIGALAAFWVVVRLIGPAMGWWSLSA